MFRSLPAVGHKLSFRQVIEAVFSADTSLDLRRVAGALPPNAVTTRSGSAALVLAFRALKRLRSGTRVVLPAYSCPSVVAAILTAGLEPVLCDMREDSFLLDPDALAALVGPDTLAIVAVHLFGIPEDMASVRKAAETQGAFIVEDATQAFGNRTAQGTGTRPLGEIGDVGVWSFGRGKPLSVMSGGALTAADPTLASAVATEREAFLAESKFSERAAYAVKLLGYSVFFHPRLFWIVRRIPGLRVGETYFSLDIELKTDLPASRRMAALASAGFAATRECRQSLEAKYRQKLARLDDGLVLPPRAVGSDVALLRFPVIFEGTGWRDRSLRALEALGLGATGMYPQTLDEIHGLKERFEPGGVFPRAASTARRLLTLPLHEHVTEDDMDVIAKVIARERHTGGPS